MRHGWFTRLRHIILLVVFSFLFRFLFPLGTSGTTRSVVLSLPLSTLLPLPSPKTMLTFAQGECHILVLLITILNPPFVTIAQHIDFLIWKFYYMGNCYMELTSWRGLLDCISHMWPVHRTRPVCLLTDVVLMTSFWHFHTNITLIVEWTCTIRFKEIFTLWTTVEPNAIAYAWREILHTKEPSLRQGTLCGVDDCVYLSTCPRSVSFLARLW